MKYCDYCCEVIMIEEDVRTIPDNLPDDIPDRNYDTTHYHRWCFERIVDEERQELLP